MNTEKTVKVNAHNANNAHNNGFWEPSPESLVALKGRGIANQKKAFNLSGAQVADLILVALDEVHGRD